MRKFIVTAIFALVALATGAQSPMPTYMRGAGLRPTDTATIGCTNIGYTGSGPCVRQNGPTLTAVKESDLLSAKAIATTSNGTHVAATTVGSGDSIVVQRYATATLTLGNVSAGGVGTVQIIRSGNTVTLNIPAILGTSNGTSGVFTGLPAAYWPASTKTGAVGNVRDNSLDCLGYFDVNTDGTIKMWKSTVNLINGSIDITGTFTGSGSKGFGGGSITYILN